MATTLRPQKHPPAAPDRPGVGPGVVFAVALATAFAPGLLILPDPPQANGSSPGPAAALPAPAMPRWPAAAPAAAMATGASVDTPPAPVGRPVPATAAHGAAAAPGPAAAPFRLVGQITVDGEVAWVFFGRGRTVMLRGAGPLDDEYTVDALLDRAVLLRHVPSAAVQRIEMATRPPDTPPAASPDRYPAD